MATATAVVTAASTGWANQKYFHGGTVAIGASPLTYKAGGIVMNLNQTNIKASRTPEKMNVYGQSGYIYAYVKGSDNSNGLLKIFVQGAAETDPLEEMADALAIPAGVSGDVIEWDGRWKGME
jgi:hypothetical protein